MKVNFNLKDKTALGETPIFVTVVYSTIRIRVNTIKSISPKHWNPKPQRARQSFEGYSTFNKWLDDVASFISQKETDWINKHSEQKEVPIMDADYLKRKLRKYLSKENPEERTERLKNSFWGYYENFLM
ncbi:MAG: hypothetical protein ACOYLO_02475, partial [Ferruginibacter sp.]